MNAIDILGSLLGGGRSGSKTGGGAADILSEILSGVDGEISDEEQKNILGQVGDTSPETIQFLRAEFARPLNVNEYAQSLPIGMEQKAYGISLMAIKLDTKEEADYLRQLAKALRISPEDCNQIHQQQNAPLMYQA